MRPLKKRKIAFNPKICYFKPQGVPLKILKEIQLSHDEVEALRLKYLQGFDQTVCAQKMKISQSTFQRILAKTNKKIARALIQGQAIKICP
ncbi:MAG: DUF134 domain-containing protein [Candidatus Moranbacteria bacterium]|nr:DUF134 domain-containing protein [Candidatus Moranbacteria bacterium]